MSMQQPYTTKEYAWITFFLILVSAGFVGIAWLANLPRVTLKIIYSLLAVGMIPTVIGWWEIWKEKIKRREGG